MGICMCESFLCDHNYKNRKDGEPRQCKRPIQHHVVMAYVGEVCATCAANMCMTGGANFIHVASTGSWEDDEMEAIFDALAGSPTLTTTYHSDRADDVERIIRKWSERATMPDRYIERVMTQAARRMSTGEDLLSAIENAVDFDVDVYR